MSEPVSMSTAVVVGSMMASGGLVTDLVIFQDDSYRVLAAVGALVSGFGVLHEIFQERPIRHTKCQICTEIGKGLVLGLFAIPFWYLVLSAFGESIIDKYIGIKPGAQARLGSVWLMISFVLSWWTVPFINLVAARVKHFFVRPIKQNEKGVKDV